MNYFVGIDATQLPAAATMHNRVMALFPSDLPGPPSERRAASNILYLAEGETVFVQSDSAPVGLPAGISPGRSDDFTVLTPGRRVGFLTVVNPTKMLTAGNKIVPLERADVPGWLAGKLSPGFADLAIDSQDRSVFHSGRSAISADRIQGQMTVADPSAAAKVLLEGIGRSRAYGCGLVVLLS